MAQNALTISDKGLQELKRHEAVINGLYDDAKGYATFGVGHLVHPAGKWNSLLLETAKTDGLCKSYIKKRWPGKLYEVEYLDRSAVTDCQEYMQLGKNAKTTGLDSVANRKFKKDYADLPAHQQSMVSETVGSAVDTEYQMLAYDVDQKLKDDLQRFESAVNANVTGVELKQDEFDALISFAFNVGIDGFKGSKLLKRINEGKYRSGTVEERKHAISQIETAFNAWNTAGGKVLSALTKRRHDEAGVFLKEAREELKSLQPKHHPASVPHHGAKHSGTAIHHRL